MKHVCRASCRNHLPSSALPSVARCGGDNQLSRHEETKAPGLPGLFFCEAKLPRLVISAHQSDLLQSTELLLALANASHVLMCLQLTFYCAHIGQQLQASICSRTSMNSEVERQ